MRKSKKIKRRTRKTRRKTKGGTQREDITKRLPQVTTSLQAIKLILNDIIYSFNDQDEEDEYCLGLFHRIEILTETLLETSSHNYSIVSINTFINSCSLICKDIMRRLPLNDEKRRLVVSALINLNERLREIQSLIRSTAIQP